MSEIDSQPFPRGALIGAGSFVGLALCLTAAVPLGLLPRPQTAEAARIETGIKPAQVRDLRFLDEADGAVRVVDANGLAPDERILPGTNQGFIRGVVRGLARDRHLRGIGQEVPFRLTRWENGRLSLRDLATDRTIELDSFGGDNSAAFARLMPPVPSKTAPIKVAAK